jgi:hypothetical protein
MPARRAQPLLHNALHLLSELAVKWISQPLHVIGIIVLVADALVGVAPDGSRGSSSLQLTLFVKDGSRRLAARVEATTPLQERPEAVLILSLRRP